MRAFSLLLLVLSWGELGDPSGFLFIASGIVLGRAW